MTTTRSTTLDLTPSQQTTLAHSITLPHAEISPELALFLNWLDRTILKDENANSEILANLSGLLIGGIGAYTAFPLGGGFGEILAKISKSDADTKYFLYVFIGTIAYLPTAILVILANQAGFKELFSHFFNKEVGLFKKSDRKKWRFSAEVLKYFFSLFTGIPFAKIMKDYVPGKLGIVLAALAALSSFTSALAAQSILLNKLFIHFEASPSKDLRLRFARQLLQSTANLNEMNASALQTFLTDLHEANDDQRLALALIQKKIKGLLVIPQQGLTSANLEESNQAFNPWIEKALVALSLMTGTAAMYALHTASESAADWFNDSIGISDSTNRRHLKNTITTLALIPNIFFSYSYIEKKISNICLDLFNKNYCPSAKTAVAATIATASSTPNTYLAIQAAHSALEYALVVPAFLGPMFARSVAFEALINKAKDRYHNYFNRNETETKRANLIGMMGKLRQAFFTVNPAYLSKLEAALFIPEPVREERASPSVSSISRVTFHGSFFQPENVVELEEVRGTHQTTVNVHGLLEMGLS